MNYRTFTEEEIKTKYPDFPLGIKKYEIHDTTRWGAVFELVFEYDDVFWRGLYELGLGDSDYDTFEDQGYLQCTEVKPMQIVRTEWFPVE